MKKPDQVKLVETAASILVLNLCIETNAEKAKMVLQGLTLKGVLLGDFEIQVKRVKPKGGK